LKKHNIFFSQFSSQSEQDLTEYTFIKIPRRRLLSFPRRRLLLDDRVPKTKNIILDALFKSAKQKWKSNRASSGSPRFFWHPQHILDEDTKRTTKLKIFCFGEEEG
jgi:hypothetical protein